MSKDNKMDIAIANRDSERHLIFLPLRDNLITIMDDALMEYLPRIYENYNPHTRVLAIYPNGVVLSEKNQWSEPTEQNFKTLSPSFRIAIRNPG